MPLRIVLLAALLSAVAGGANAYVKLSGNLDRNHVLRRQTLTETFTIEVTDKPFRGLNVYLHGAEGIDVLDTTFNPPLLTCTQLNGAFKTCASGGDLPVGVINVTQTLGVRQDAVHDVQTFSVELGGDFLSGAPLLVGLISLDEARPHLVPTMSEFAMLAVQETGDTLKITVLNEGNVTGAFSVKSAPSFLRPPSGLFAVVPGAVETVSIPLDTGLDKGMYKGVITISRPPDDDVTVKVRIALIEPGSPFGNPQPNTTRLTINTGGTGSKSVPSSSFQPLPTVNPAASLTISNSGPGALSGIFAADASWIIAPDSLISIPAGGSQSFDIAVDTTLLPDFNANGSSVGTLRLLYLSPASTTGSGQPIARDGGSSGSTSSISVTIAAVSQSPATAATIPPLEHRCQPDGGANLCWDESAMFIPGVRRTSDSRDQFISDLKVYPKVGFGSTGVDQRSITDINIYFTPLKAAPSAAKKINIPSVAPPNVAIYGDVLSSMYGSSSDIGTLQIRGPNFQPEEIVGTSATILNVTPRGAYGANLPLLASYRAAKKGDKVYLTGLQQGSGAHTEIYLQEGIGVDATAAIDFYDAAGKKTGTANATLPAFTGQQLDDALVPAGTVSAVITSGLTGGGVLAYAMPVDDTTGDRWSVLADTAASFTKLVPVAASIHGVNGTYFKTDLTIMNPNVTPTTLLLRFVNTRGATIDKTLTVNALETKVLSDVTTGFFGVTTDNLGYLLVMPGDLVTVISARAYATGPSGTYASEIPIRSTSGDLFTQGRPARIAGVDDATYDSATARKPGTVRTNFALIETKGKPAQVKVTVYYRATQDKATTLDSISQTYSLAPNQMLMGTLANVFGANRTALGDLHGVTVEFSLLSATGQGAVVPVIMSVDNATGDSIVRLP